MNATRTPPPVSRRTISIETKPTQEGKKTRTFSVDLLAWVLAKEAANKDSGHMMDLALRLLAFNTYNDG